MSHYNTLKEAKEAKYPNEVNKHEEKKFDQNAYIREYNEKTYDRIELKIPKGKKAEWKAKAKAEGLSLTEWITKQVEK